MLKLQPRVELAFLTSKRFLSPASALALALAVFALVTGASAMSTSAMVAMNVELSCGVVGSYALLELRWHDMVGGEYFESWIRE